MTKAVNSKGMMHMTRTPRIAWFIRYKGERLRAAEWARRVGINLSTLRHRLLVSGWELRRAMTTQVAARK